MHKLIFLILLLFSTVTFGQEEYIRKVTKDLTAPEMHGRGYVNGGDSLAAIYIANEMKALGIQPYKKSYYQPFSFPVNSFPGFVQLSNSDLLYQLGADYLVEAESGSFNGKLNFYRIPSVSKDSLKFFLEEIKLVFNDTNYNAISFELDSSLYKGERKTLVNQLALELAKYRPVFIKDETKWSWSVSSVSLNFPVVRVRDDVKLVDGMHLRVDTNLKNHQTQNVIGYIPAKRKSKKTFVFTAHYDHLGRLGQEVYFPGANDNASGTAALLAIGKYFSENKPDFNVMLIAFAGEEAGLLGSEYYVNHPLFPLKDIHFLLNVDIFGSGETGITVVNGSVFTSAFDQLVAINDEKKYLSKIKARGKAANSDHYHFSERGVPAFFIYTEGPNKNYHDIFDTYENLTFAKAEDLIQLLIEFSKMVTK